MNSPSSKYLIDANIFMEAARRYYPLDFAKPFWDGLLTFAQQGKVTSIDKVLSEIQCGNDPLKDWAETSFQNYFLSTQTSSVLQQYVIMVQWAQAQQQYNQTAKDRFMEDDNADTWVLAYAKANNCIIVTHELPDANIKKNIPIPNVCNAYQIPYCDTFHMLRQLGFSF